MVNEDIKYLRHLHNRMETVLNELSVLEDGDGADYSEVRTDLAWICNMLEHRRTSLQKRGRCL